MFDFYYKKDSLVYKDKKHCRFRDKLEPYKYLTLKLTLYTGILLFCLLDFV